MSKSVLSIRQVPFQISAGKRKEIKLFDTHMYKSMNLIPSTQNIIFLNKGHREWVGDMSQIYTSDNQPLNDFVFATDLFQEVKRYLVETKK